MSMKNKENILRKIPNSKIDNKMFLIKHYYCFKKKKNEKKGSPSSKNHGDYNINNKTVINIALQPQLQ